MDAHKQYIQLSVFDRLEESNDEGFIGGHGQDIAYVRKAVLRDVENLLNTRRSIVAPAESYHYLNRSVFVYGLADFVAKNARSPEVRKALKAGIEQTLALFEPRLLDVSVQFNPNDGNAQNICFAVGATLFADPIREPIHFDTWFSVNRAEYHVEDKIHNTEKV